MIAEGDGGVGGVRGSSMDDWCLPDVAGYGPLYYCVLEKDWRPQTGTGRLIYRIEQRGAESDEDDNGFVTKGSE